MKRSTLSERALILAPRGRDAAIAAAILAEADLAGHACPSLPNLLGELEAGAAFVVVTEEALATADLAPIAAWLADQEEWSDLPFVLLTSGHAGLERNPAAKRYLSVLGNVTFLERPFHPTTLVSLARSALRARRRQYEARARLSERREAEERLRDLNADLERRVTERALARGRTWHLSPEIMGVLNAEGYFEQSNPAWATVLGWSEPEVASTLFFDLIHPGDLARTRAAWVAAIEHGEPALRFENRYRTKDGHWRWLSWVAVPDDGKVYCSARDVTAEKAQEAELAARTAERDRMWQTSPDLLLVVGFDGVFRRVNPAWGAVLGYEEQELVGARIDRLIHPDDLALTEQALVDAASAPVPAVENRYRHKDGSYRWTSWITAPPQDGLIYATGRHVTAEKERQAELEAAQEQLRQAQKMEAVGQLTGGVAHDFNNLLTIIKSSTDLLRRSGIPEERRRRYVDAISDTVDRAAKLTGQLLAFARRQALKPEAFNVADRIQAITEMLATIVGSRVPIVAEVSDVPCWVMADASQFETALVNMAVNARDAMNGEGTLTVRVHRASQVPAIRGHEPKVGDFVCVVLSDAGSGIPADKLGHIFEPFYTTKEVGKGTGLGLSQVFGFVKQSGGDVSVESEVGRGSTFTLYLPRVERDRVPDGAVSDAAAAGLEEHGRGRRVLVVEDNVEVGRFSTQILQDLGYEPTLAANGDEALRLLDKANGFDVVFSDVVMPGMSGVELGEEIRRRHPGLPVVLTSGYSHVLAEEGRHGFDLLKKPYAAEDLSRLLRRVARVRRAQSSSR